MPFRSYNQLNSQPKYTEIPRVPSDKGLWEVLDYYGFGFLGYRQRRDFLKKMFRAYWRYNVFRDSSVSRIRPKLTQTKTLANDDCESFDAIRGYKGCQHMPTVIVDGSFASDWWLVNVGDTASHLASCQEARGASSGKIGCFESPDITCRSDATSPLWPRYGRPELSLAGASGGAPAPKKFLG